MGKAMAGSKLRAQAIARTIDHIGRVEARKSGLIGELSRRTGYGYTSEMYVTEERARLEKLRTLST